MQQTKAFLAIEADKWFERNKHKIGTEQAIKDDLLLRLINESGIKPKNVLEVGCSNGWRLNELYRQYGCRCAGVEPSVAAQEDALRKYPAVTVHHGMAHQLNFQDSEFDLVIFGFCLYLVEPRWLFLVAAEGDRVLKDGGNLAILDFYAPTAHSVVYHHSPSLRSYKMIHTNLWLSHPAYRGCGEAGSDPTARMLHKDMAHSFPLQEQA